MIVQTRWFLLGASAALLLSCAVASLHAVQMARSCHARQVEASAWTARNQDPTFPASLVPDCGVWDRVLMVSVPVGLASAFLFAGVGLLQARHARSRPSS